MTRYVVVQNPAPSVLDDKEAIEQLEGHRRHRKEIEGGDRFAMILQERQPALGRISATTNPSQIPGDASFRDDKAELLQLAVIPGSAPARVLVGPASDQHTNLLGNLRSAAARPGTPMPVKAKTSAVPTDNRLGLDDDKDIPPARGTVPQHPPEKPVGRIQFLRGRFRLNTASCCRSASTSIATSL